MLREVLIVDGAEAESLAFGVLVSERGVVAIDCLETLPSGGGIRGESETSHPIMKQTVRELCEYFAGERRVFEVSVDLKAGTPFQREVWAELSRIPYGQTISYGQQAKNMGRPSAVRAVGGANGKNPLPIIIPCHRVLSSAGKLHGFAAGLDLKRRLLAVEGVDVRS